MFQALILQKHTQHDSEKKQTKKQPRKDENTKNKYSKTRELVIKHLTQSATYIIKIPLVISNQVAVIFSGKHLFFQNERKKKEEETSPLQLLVTSGVKDLHTRLGVKASFHRRKSAESDFFYMTIDTIIKRSGERPRTSTHPDMAKRIF